MADSKYPTPDHARKGEVPVSAMPGVVGPVHHALEDILDVCRFLSKAAFSAGLNGGLDSAGCSGFGSTLSLLAARLDNLTDRLEPLAYAEEVPHA